MGSSALLNLALESCAKTISQICEITRERPLVQISWMIWRAVLESVLITSSNRAPVSAPDWALYTFQGYYHQSFIM
ncbi:hypothetical protein L207DRAFT_124214 [Hyaloscypha variabilis F]|uniref:Uncharacterized protein n=1 Tax=Hyaloscypha variabilis (strain UAMH 11265 / GT02V1 / F) TaxID=1149755 RepID=A0A2J6R807_HYAVF|nr:hypothetical protein L207DRAFT_124214 [Hyaloscypha variabilis F]